MKSAASVVFLFVLFMWLTAGTASGNASPRKHNSKVNQAARKRAKVIAVRSKSPRPQRKLSAAAIAELLRETRRKGKEKDERELITGTGLRADQPGEAAEFFRQKRLLPGQQNELSLERYFTAQKQMEKMPRYSSALGRYVANATGQFSAEALPGTWTFLGPGNIGGRTRALLIHPTSPDTMYAAGATGGVWKTTNAGASWTPISDLLANINVSVMAMDRTNPQVIYAGTGEYYNQFRGAGIFKTTDGGATWTQLTATATADFHYLFDIVISPNNAQRIYASTSNGVLRSTDGGATWTRIFSSDNQTGVIGLPYDLAIRSDKPTDDLLLAFYEGFPNVRGHFYRNPDAGGAGTWTATLSEAGLSRAALAISPTNQNVVYAIGVSNNTSSQYYNALHAFYKSTDGGQTWTATIRNTDAASINTSILSYLGGSCNPTYGFRGQGFYDLAIAVDPLDENRVWVGGITWFRSDDGGRNFGVAAYGGNSYAHPDQHSIAFHPNYNGTTNQTMFIGNDGGVYRSDNARAAVVTDNTAMCNGTNPSVVWRPINNSYGVTQFYHGAVYPDGKTYFGGTQDNGTQRGSDASGANGWWHIRGGDGGYVALDPTNTNVLYAENTGLSLVKSTDGGSSYSTATNGISGDSGFLFITPFTMDASDPNRLWIGGSYLWRTADGAASWTRASPAVSGNTSAIAVAPTDSNYVASGTSTGYFYRTTVGMTNDGNTAWPNSRPRSGYLSWLTYDPVNKNIIYATYATFGAAHVWKTTDLGATWTSIDGTGNGALPDIPVHCLIVDPENTQRLFIGTDLGVFVSLDGGASWAAENTGFANVKVESLTLNIHNGIMTLYAFTHGRGVWKVDVGTGCSYTLAPSHPTFGVNGGNGTVTVTSTPSTGCAWTATSNVPWITVNSYDSTTVNYTVAANTGATRTGTMRIAGKTYQVTQTCTDVSATSLNLSAAGGTAAINVTTNGCAWTAGSNASWIQITSGSSGNANGTVNINVDVTNSTGARTGTLTIAGRTVTVTQAGGTLDLELTRTNTGTLNPDSDLTYTLTVKNVGTATTSGTMQIAESLTNNGLYMGASGANWTVNSFTNGVLTMTRSAALKPGESTSVAVTIRPSILAIPTLSVSGTVTLAGDGNAANNTSAHQFAVANPVPVISRVNPPLVGIGVGSFSLAVEGSMFTPNSKVRFNGVERVTTYVNNIRLNAQVLATDVQYGGVINVTVTTPAPGGGTSNVQPLTVNAGTPFLTGHSPSTVTAGGAAFTLTATGSWFNPNSVVRWNGADRPTTFVSSTQLTAQIPASDIVNAGTANITVFTPAPGGGTSATRTVTINANAPAPSLASISPASITVGSNDFTLTATGSNFMPNSVIRWNGANRTTTYVSATQLTAVIPSTDLQSSGTAKISVTTPAPGGGTTTEQTFTLSPRPITTVSGASYAPTTIGRDAIASAFGMEMATTTLAATSLPLPTTLGGTTVKVKDSAGVERLAPLFFVSPTQVNFQIPAGTANGATTLTITSSDNKITTGSLEVVAVAPGLFTANASGNGLAAATVQRVRGDGSQSIEQITTFDAQNKIVPIPIDLGPATDQVYLNLYGTGVRFNAELSKVTATVGGENAQVFYAGAHCCFVGVDQLNVLLPRTLIGRGTVNLVLTVEGKVANTVQINVK